MAEKMIASAELIIAVFDGSCPLTADDQYLINKIDKNKTVAVINKSDVEQLLDTAQIERQIKHIVYISAKENTGVEERQKNCIDKSLESIESAISSLEIGEMLDAVNILIDEAEQSLLQLTGEKVTDAVVDEVFSRFCVGK